jgi:hypothetical protein
MTSYAPRHLIADDEVAVMEVLPVNLEIEKGAGIENPNIEIRNSKQYHKA